MKIHFRRFTSLFLLSIFTFILVSACSGNIESNIKNSKQSTEDCRTIQHTMGETCVPADPKRIVALDMDNLGNLLAMVIKPIAANSGWNAVEPFPKHLQNKMDGVENVGSMTQPNLEKILLLKPDLIVTNTPLKPFYSQLSEIAPTVVMQHPEIWKQKLTELAKVLNKEDTANRLMDDYWQRINKLKKTLGDKRTQIRVSAATVQKDNGIYAYGSKHPSGIVLKDIGVQRPSSQIGDFYYTQKLSPETLPEIDGDVLFFVTWKKQGDKEAFEKLQENPLWNKLKVVQNNRVYVMDSDHWHKDNSILGVNAVIDDLFKYLVNAT